MEPESTPQAFSYREITPDVRIESRGQGFVQIEMEGYESRRSELGAPDLPTRTILVAIPPGAKPWLETAPAGRRSFRPVRPAPRVKIHAGPPTAPGASPEAAFDLRSRPVPVYRPDPAFYGTEATYPSTAVWLGKIGVLRQQRYVEVHLAPVRYDGLSEGLVVDSAVEFTVRFDGAGTTTAVPAGDSPFESIYRNAFVNYSQGRGFRLSPSDSAVEIGSTVTRIRATTAGSASGPRRRLLVSQNGLLRLDHAFLQANAPEFLPLPVANWVLTSQGVQVPLHIEQISGSGFDDTLIDRPGEFVQFYAQAMDLEPISEFISDDGGTGDLLYEARDFTDTNVYFLTVSASAQPSVTTRDATPGAEPLAGDYFYDTAHEESDDFFWPFADQDLYYWAPFVDANAPLRTDAVPLPNLHSTTLPITVRVQIRGALECRTVTPDKKTGISLENVSLESLLLPASNPDNDGNVNIGIFDGNHGHTHEFEWVHGPGEPETSSPLHVSTQIYDTGLHCDEPSGPVNEDILMDWIEVDYARTFEALGDTLVFTWPDGPPTLFEVDGFSGSVEVYEITNLAPSSYVYDAVRLLGTQMVPDGPGFTARFRMDNDLALTDGTLRRFVVTTAGTIPIPNPAEIEADRVSELMSDTTQADMLVVVHPDLITSFCSESLGPCDTDNDCGNGDSDRCELDATSELAALLALRDSQGKSSRVARMPDIEDEFNHGLPGPLGIRNFIAWLLAGGWQGDAPIYAMLVGDSSYDYKAGTANGTFTPTQLVLKTDDILAYYSSDNLLACVIGDDFMPDLVVGRIPARLPAEADAVFQKIRQYDEVPTAGAWRSNVLMMSDKGHGSDGAESEQFELMNQASLTYLDSAYTNQNLRFWTDYCGGGTQVCNADAMHDAIIDGINGDLDLGLDGAVVAQFVGHGNFDLWSDNVFFCANDANNHPRCAQDDTESLFNDDDPGNVGGRLPWLIVHNCLTGGFHGEQLKSMGEQWIKRDLGGAIAVLSPSGLGFRFIGYQVIDEVWGAIFGPAKERELIVPVMNNLVRLCTVNNSPESCQYHVLLGDPSMRLALPHVDAPTALQAAPGNAEVTLNWNASATPSVDYRIYRARYNLVIGKASSYSYVGTTPNNSFVDSTVINSLNYVYYVLARDTDGFDSAWSNFNTGCKDDPISDDCVLVRPLNYTPPIQPTGGQTEDPATGGRLLVSWDPNPENDLDFYTVHYGTTPALGQTSEASKTAVSLHGLENQELHYFRITATNTSGTTSAMSDEFTGTPTLVLGLRSPDLVTDLMLDRSGDDALLSWGAVTLDIYGDAVDIGQYEVFRGELAQFVPAPENRIASTPATGFTDSAAAVWPDPNYFYLVRALDLAGNPGGAGRQLPDGIGNLLVDQSETPGQLLLSWSPVTTDFDQQPTQISHYELYASDQPYGRAEIEQGSVELLNGAISGESIEILPELQNRYYSVLAVDVRGNRSPY